MIIATAAGFLKLIGFILTMGSGGFIADLIGEGADLGKKVADVKDSIDKFNSILTITE